MVRYPERKMKYNHKNEVLMNKQKIAPWMFKAIRFYSMFHISNLY